MNINFKLSVVFIKEGKRYIAHSPALDLSTSGKNFEEAKRRFEEASLLFFQETIRKGLLKKALNELGWKKQKREWQPPIVVSRNIETISVPVSF